MKNKIKTYLLLVAVLAIWGAIGFRIINGLSTSEAVVANNDFEQSFTPKKIAVNETFEIANIDRDPFLGTLTTKRKPKKRITKKTTEIKGPTIIYLGLIKNELSSNKIFVVNINSNQQLLKKGQEINGVKLLKGNSKQIEIRFNNKNQIILLQ